MQESAASGLDATDGLGPTFNGDSCAGCHSTPVTGGVSSITELRAGHLDHRGNFVPATAFVNFGTEPIPNRSLINLKATCPAARETLTPADDIRALRLSLNVLGDGYVEAIADRTLKQIAGSQERYERGDVVEVPSDAGGDNIGRFGWKDQHLNLLAFSSDAYLNEMGVTNQLAPNQRDFTRQCDPANNDPEDTHNDIDIFARFMRSTKVPPRDTVMAATPAAQAGSILFDQIGCGDCHVRTIATAPPGTRVAGNIVPPCLGNKIIHPFSDFLLHDVGTGDGIVQNGGQDTLFELRTAPLWGLRTHPVFMHDGGSPTILSAIQRHSNQARGAVDLFNGRVINGLSEAQRGQVLAFLNSL